MEKSRPLLKFLFCVAVFAGYGSIAANAAVDEKDAQENLFFGIQGSEEKSSVNQGAVGSFKTDAGNRYDERQLQVRMQQIGKMRQQAALALQSAQQNRQQALIAQASVDQTVAKLAMLNVSKEAPHKPKIYLFLTQKKIDRMQIQQNENGVMITLGDELYQGGEWHPTTAGWRNIRAVANILEQYPSRPVVIEGFAGPPMMRQNHSGLTKQQLHFLQASLIERGISADRLETPWENEAYLREDNRCPCRPESGQEEVLLSDDFSEPVFR